MSKERSPFSPGQPVAPEFFVGRDDQVKLLTRAIRQAAAGRPQYVFVTGERGIGKSSLASLAREIAEKEFGFVGAHALLGGSETLGEVCRRLYQALLSQLPEKRLIDKARKVFEGYVEGVDLFGFGVKFRRDAGSRASLADNFLPLLAKVRQSFEEEGRKGIVLIADDLNGIAGEARFAEFLKSTVDQMAVGPMRSFPWVLILVGVPERMDDLKAQQPSIDRVFQPVELSLMDEEVAAGFYRRAFASVNHTLQEGALAVLARASGGFPVIWHELGEAVFWEDEDQIISAQDATTGLRNAVQNVGRKYLQRPLYDELRSPVYQKILQFVANSVERSGTIVRSEAMARLSKREARNFDNFIRKMRDMNVLRVVARRRGQYEFTNFLFQFYVMLQSGSLAQQGGRIRREGGD